MQPASCTNTHHDITDLINHGYIENVTFLQNKKKI